MLFSQPDLARFLSDSFECAWESVRPVPRLTLDFGDGRVLERTLRGNIATYVCTSEGETFDLVPGLMDAREYERRLGESLELFANLRDARVQKNSGKERTGQRLVARWHRRASARILESLPRQEVPPATARGGLSKFRVEGVLERTLTASSTPDASGLLLDTNYARERGHRQAHHFLAVRPLQPPAALTRDVYRELLHIDLDDPFLGLAPNVLGGEPGRHPVPPLSRERRMEVSVSAGSAVPADAPPIASAATRAGS